jgi:hypothetical protein
MEEASILASARLHGVPCLVTCHTVPATQPPLQLDAARLAGGAALGTCSLADCLDWAPDRPARLHLVPRCGVYVCACLRGAAWWRGRRVERRKERSTPAVKCAPGGMRTHTPSVEYRVLYYATTLPGRGRRMARVWAGGGAAGVWGEAGPQAVHPCHARGPTRPRAGSGSPAAAKPSSATAGSGRGTAAAFAAAWQAAGESGAGAGRGRATHARAACGPGACRGLPAGHSGRGPTKHRRAPRAASTRGSKLFVAHIQ